MAGEVASWTGVSIGNERVHGITLPDCNLDGSIPKEIQFLTELRELYLWGNNLQSPIPTELWNHAKLERLDLSGNALSGVLPDTINVGWVSCGVFGCTPYGWLFLSHNNLVGSLPIAPKAGRIALKHNSFSGSVPASYVYGLKSYVDIGHNKLTVWPDSGGSTGCNFSCTRSYLLASNNLFSGPLPGYWTHNSDFVLIDLSHNSFSGELPSHGFRADYWGGHLNLSFNRFSGTVPAGFLSHHWSHIDLRYNELSGVASSASGGHRAIDSLNLSNNALSEIAPLSLRSLRWLDLSNNALSGIDSHDLPRIQWLDLSGNAFSEWDPDLFELTNLNSLDLSGNFLSGDVPPTVVNMQALKELWLAGNQYSDEVPPGFSYLLELELLDLSDNGFSSNIPSFMGEFHDLKTLNLSHNQFDGSIPDIFGRLSALDSLDLSYNQLTGELPPSLIDLTGLKHLDLSGNDLLGSLAGFANNPGLTAIDVSGNSFSEGLFAVDSTMYPELKLLDLSHNDFAGSLDQVIAGPTKLTVLRVSENEFEGDVPEALAESKDLVTIRLNENDFSSLPDLTALSSLDTLDVGGNALTFEHLEANRPFTSSASFTFAPQDTIEIGLKRTDTQVKLRTGTLGTNNAYRWYRNGTLMAGEVSEELLIPISAPVADYHAEVTNSWFPGLTLISHPIASDAMPVGNWELEQTPLSFELFPSYPNPSRSEIRIPFELEKTVDTRISVTDLLGREVRTLIDNTMVSGRHEIQMNVRGLAPGLYFIHAQLGDYRQSRQFIVMQ